jgi:hypothetical protein
MREPAGRTGAVELVDGRIGAQSAPQSGHSIASITQALPCAGSRWLWFLSIATPLGLETEIFTGTP